MKFLNHQLAFGGAPLIELLRQTSGPMHFVRELVAAFGLRCDLVSYDKPPCKYGGTKRDILGLVDQSMLSLTMMSRVPMSFATLLGLFMSVAGFILALGYLVAKLLFWWASSDWDIYLRIRANICFGPYRRVCGCNARKDAKKALGGRSRVHEFQ